MPHPAAAPTSPPGGNVERPDLRLSVALDLAEDGPRVVVRSDGPEVGTWTYGTDVQHIVVPLAAGSVRRIEALDVMEHVTDEQVFLAECARLLGTGGELRLRVPVDGLTGWLDAINLYRYLAETTGLAPEPDEPQPTGWHRHYRKRDLLRLVGEAGFSITDVRAVNPGLAELPHAAGLVAGSVLLKRPETERTLFRLRRRVADLENALPAGPFATRLDLTARRV